MSTTLYSYCIPYDDGAAPNPFWGLCTLAICKPVIRRVAKEGDWVVGTGSVNSPIGNISGKVVYAMRVTRKMTMEDYDWFTKLELPDKIPLRNSADLRRSHGDSIYDFSATTPSLRPSVHNKENQNTDLGGKYVLLSNHFFYFGDKPASLPEALRNIARQQQGHRSSANAPYIEDFVRWIHSLGYPPAKLMGNPQWWSKPDFQASRDPCAIGRRQEAEADLEELNAPCSNPC
jgi:Nucleotide modification associated domain 2